MLMTHEVASWGCFRQAQIFVGCENALTRLGQLEALACNHHGPLLPPRPCHYDMVHNAYVQVPWLQCLKALYKLAGLGAVLTPGARLEALPPRRSLLCAEPLCVPARPSCHRATSLSVGLLLQRSCFACSGCSGCVFLPDTVSRKVRFVPEILHHFEPTRGSSATPNFNIALTQEWLKPGSTQMPKILHDSMGMQH